MSLVTKILGPRPTPTPTPRPTPTPTPPATATPEPTPTPSPAPSPTPTPAPTPAPEPTPSPAPAPTPAPVSSNPAPAVPVPQSSAPGPASEPVRAVQITVMREAVRQAVIDARAPAAANKWLDLPAAVMAETAAEETVARSKADILKEASTAMLAQANQTRESVRSLLQATD